MATSWGINTVVAAAAAVGGLIGIGVTCVVLGDDGRSGHYDSVVSCNAGSAIQREMVDTCGQTDENDVGRQWAEYVKAIMTDVMFRPWMCRAFEEHIMLKKGQAKKKSVSVLGGMFGGDFAGQLRNIKVAPNLTSMASNASPSIKFLAYEFWSSDRKTSVLEKGESGQLQHKEMLEGYGSKWAIEWEVPVDIDLKVDYKMQGKLSSAATQGSVSVAMRSLVVKGEIWLFLQPHPSPDGIKSIVVHFEDKPEIAFHLAGEARNSSVVGATAGRALAYAAKQITGTDPWDLAVKFVKERVDKEIAVHASSSAVSYQISLPSGEAGEQHYEAGALFRTTTSNPSVVASSLRREHNASFSEIVKRASTAAT